MANEKALELFKDESFVKELGMTQTAEEAQKLFESKGGEITIDELKVIRAMAKQQAGEKLDNEELDLVAGGSFLPLFPGGGPGFGLPSDLRDKMLMW